MKVGWLSTGADMGYVGRDGFHGTCDIFYCLNEAGKHGVVEVQWRGSGSGTRGRGQRRGMLWLVCSFFMVVLDRGDGS